MDYATTNWQERAAYHRKCAEKQASELAAYKQEVVSRSSVTVFPGGICTQDEVRSDAYRHVWGRLHIERDMRGDADLAAGMSVVWKGDLVVKADFDDQALNQAIPKDVRVSLVSLLEVSSLGEVNGSRASLSGTSKEWAQALRMASSMAAGLGVTIGGNRRFLNA
jgi:hypothetical protein